MDWPTWDQAALTAALTGVAFVLLRQARPSRLRAVLMPATLELTLMAALYSIWRMARVLPLDHQVGAIERARDIDRWQHAVHLPSELSLQHFVLDHQWLGRLMNYYYAILHVPALIAFMVWLFARHRHRYAHWRNALAMLTGFCVIIRFIRVAPPRYLPDLGYIDLASRFGWSVYGPVGTGVSDQFAAMPSIHVGWAAVVSFGVVAVSTSRWRWLALIHVVMTMLAVSATGNHWWADGIVAIALLALALLIDSGARRMWRARRAGAAEDSDGDYAAADDIAYEPA
ncbi:MAG TPA: phosphatase PAP2 family protein [Ilumatobacteraceae bacterium]